MAIKIILVEDDPAIIDIYQTVLKKAQFDVESVILGQEAINRVKDVEKSRPDVVLLDLILPDMNGVEVLQAIKNNPATKSIKVFILTNQENVETVMASDVKPDKFIIKANITPTQLADVLKKELGS